MPPDPSLKSATPEASLAAGALTTFPVSSPALQPARIRPAGASGVRRIAAFFATVAAAVIACDVAVNHGLRQIETSGFGVSNRIFSGRAGADILITGSSRALTHYDPRIIEEITGRTAFNIGRNGSQTDMQVAVLRAYLRHNPPPGLLIHNLDLFSFATSHEIYDPAQYLPYLSDEALYGTIRRLHPDAWKWKHVPLYGYAVADMRFTWLRGLGGLAGIEPREDHFRGFKPRYSSWTGEFEQFVRDNPQGVTFPIEPQGIEDLRAVILTGREYGIPVVFVYSPEYHGVQALERNRAEVFAQFRALAEPAGVPIWDYSDSPLSRTRDNFYNSQHLNAHGAAAFSRDLARWLAASPFLPPLPPAASSR